MALTFLSERCPHCPSRVVSGITCGLVATGGPGLCLFVQSLDTQPLCRDDGEDGGGFSPVTREVSPLGKTGFESPSAKKRVVL